MPQTGFVEPAGGVVTYGVLAPDGKGGVLLLQNTALMVGGSQPSANTNIPLQVFTPGGAIAFAVSSGGAATFASDVAFAGNLAVASQATIAGIIVPSGGAGVSIASVLRVASQANVNTFIAAGAASFGATVNAATALIVGSQTTLQAVTTAGASIGGIAAVNGTVAVVNLVQSNTGAALASGGAIMLAMSALAATNAGFGLFAGSNATPGSIGAAIGSLYLSQASASNARLWSCSASSTNGTNLWIQMTSS